VCLQSFCVAFGEVDINSVLCFVVCERTIVRNNDTFFVYFGGIVRVVDFCLPFTRSDLNRSMDTVEAQGDGQIISQSFCCECMHGLSYVTREQTHVAVAAGRRAVFNPKGCKYSSMWPILEKTVGVLSAAVICSSLVVFGLGFAFSALGTVYRSFVYGGASFLLSHSFDTRRHEAKVRYRWWMHRMAWVCFYSLSFYGLYALISVGVSGVWLTFTIMMISGARELAGFALYSSMDDPIELILYSKRSFGVVSWIGLVSTATWLWTAYGSMRPIVFALLSVVSPLVRRFALWQGNRDISELDARLNASVDIEVLITVLPLSLPDFNEALGYLFARIIVQVWWFSSFPVVIVGLFMPLLSVLLLATEHQPGGSLTGIQIPVRFAFVLLFSIIAICLHYKSFDDHCDVMHLKRADVRWMWEFVVHCVCVSCGYAGLALLLSP
jgi:hypothetical protein